MKQALRVCTAMSALALSSFAAAEEFHLYDHNKQCGIESPRLEPYSQAELDDFLACIVAERDAMGRMLHRWSDLDEDLKESCIASSAETGSPDVVSYIEVEDCINHQSAR
ncbi:hypothetical protein [Halomonas citrativorans]|uniref:Secreted protein n=1 Tax=Halomonas citrativorans TaxID=2742612 RepID=A0ABR9FBE0_9GAMM|nr:hypothetical protein [Halomonas citrativorans]MBE0403057.1 hypothetical protein [Halomonas citrativorans]